MESILVITKDQELASSVTFEFSREVKIIDCISDTCISFTPKYDIVYIYSKVAANLLYDIRQVSNVPVIIIGNDKSDAVSFLEAGADDFMALPISLRELYSRSGAVIRRCKSVKITDHNELVYENLVISRARYDVRCNGQIINLSSREFEILYLLASNPQRVFSRLEILDHAFGTSYDGDLRSVDVHIKKIRDKLGSPSKKWEIHTVRTVGYKFQMQD